VIALACVLLSVMRTIVDKWGWVEWMTGVVVGAGERSE